MEYNIFSNKVRKNVRIVQISELYYSLLTSIKKLDNIASDILSRNPDYIVICGDIFYDNDNYRNKLMVFLENLASNVPVYITLGDRDIMTKITHGYDGYEKMIYKDRTAIFNEINNIPGVMILDNKKVFLEQFNISLAGFNPSFDYYEESMKDPAVFIKEINAYYDEELPKDSFNEVICHCPRVILNKKYFNGIIINKNADLIHSSRDNTFNSLAYRFVFPDNRMIKGPLGEVYPILAKNLINIGKTKGIISDPITAVPEIKGRLADFINSVFKPDITEINIRKR